MQNRAKVLKIRSARHLSFRRLVDVMRKPMIELSEVFIIEQCMEKVDMEIKDACRELQQSQNHLRKCLLGNDEEENRGHLQRLIDQRDIRLRAVCGQLRHQMEALTYAANQPGACCKLDNEEPNCVQDAVEAMERCVTSAKQNLEDLEEVLRGAADSAIEHNKFRSDGVGMGVCDEQVRPALDSSTAAKIKASIKAFADWENIFCDTRLRAVESATDDAVTQLRLVFQNSLFECAFRVDFLVFGNVHISDKLDIDFEAVGRALDTERNLQSIDPFSQLPTTLILSAGRLLSLQYQKIVSALERGLKLSQSISLKFENFNNCLGPGRTNLFKDLRGRKRISSWRKENWVRQWPKRRTR